MVSKTIVVGSNPATLNIPLTYLIRVNFKKFICYNKQEFDSGSDECLEFVLYSASLID